MMRTAHERSNKLGVGQWGNPSQWPKGQAYLSTMDLFNNAVGLGIVEMTVFGPPDTTDIQKQLNALFTGGALWIWDGAGAAADSDGILLKSNGQKIF